MEGMDAAGSAFEGVEMTDADECYSHMINSFTSYPAGLP
jgi:hypothetical protein